MSKPDPRLQVRRVFPQDEEQAIETGTGMHRKEYMPIMSDGDPFADLLEAEPLLLRVRDRLAAFVRAECDREDVRLAVEVVVSHDLEDDAAGIALANTVLESLLDEAEGEGAGSTVPTSLKREVESLVAAGPHPVPGNSLLRLLGEAGASERVTNAARLIYSVNYILRKWRGGEHSRAAACFFHLGKLFERMRVLPFDHCVLKSTRHQKKMRELGEETLAANLEEYCKTEKQYRRVRAEHTDWSKEKCYAETGRICGIASRTVFDHLKKAEESCEKSGSEHADEHCPA